MDLLVAVRPLCFALAYGWWVDFVQKIYVLLQPIDHGLTYGNVLVQTIQLIGNLKFNPFLQGGGWACQTDTLMT